jgi:hypothetical protein
MGKQSMSREPLSCDPDFASSFCVTDSAINACESALHEWSPQAWPIGISRLTPKRVLRGCLGNDWPPQLLVSPLMILIISVRTS